MKCTRCGQCCKEEVCIIAEKAFGYDLQAPCPMLYEHKDSTYSCAFVLAEIEFKRKPVIWKYLGIGGGCSNMGYRR